MDGDTKKGLSEPWDAGDPRALAPVPAPLGQPPRLKHTLKIGTGGRAWRGHVPAAAAVSNSQY
ncbi:hypothetical protein NXT3_CH02932 [Sinorhizobium fredii]|uniref:Uncharacterized protein n=1 Tax=Rhizobium fredii TaxID=380 RepID=A0A2L0H7S2_RHIFR|nr:hypothetical protein NXT3_CH02932 [Sinorhizobium fredii]